MAAAGSAVTPREAEVLALVGRQLTNAQIGSELFISVRTVEAHVAALLRKLQVPDRRALAGRASATRTVTAAWPEPSTPFVGREAERDALTRALACHRFVTAIGPGGIGKSRLAISVASDIARERSDGGWFVDLVRVTDPTAVVDAVAAVVGASQQSAASAADLLVSSLAPRDGVLVLDNCEHLLDGVRDCVDRIVSRCTRITVLATSRTRLLLPFEHLFPVPGLSVDDAITLFAARVLDATGEAIVDHARIGALCQALDGMALAIELAASRYPTLGVDGLEAGLHERLRFFAVGSQTAGRHRSLRDTIEWSCDLLGRDDGALLRGVALFASWFDVDAANIVAAPDRSRAAVADGLARLADHSLLAVERSAPTRYRALETIRQYGQERLEEAGELSDVERRHETWCCAVVAELAAGPPDDAWCERFDRVVDDARAALVRCAAFHDHRARAAELAEMLATQLWLRGRLVESQRWYEWAADRHPQPGRQLQLLRTAAGAAGSRMAGDDELRLLRRSADLALPLGDLHGATRDLAWMSLLVTRSPGTMAVTRTAEEAETLLTEAAAISDGSAPSEAAMAVARAYGDYVDLTVERAEHAVTLAGLAGDHVLEDAALDLLIAVHLRLDDLPAAIDTVHRRDATIASLPMVPANGEGHSDHCLFGSEVLLAAGELAGAAAYADRLADLPFLRDEEFLGLARRLKVDALAGRFEEALRNAARFRASWERDGRPTVPNLASCTYAVAMVHGILGDSASRDDWSQVTDDLIAGQLSPSRFAWQAMFDALVDLHWGRAEAAVQRLAVAVDDGAAWWHASQIKVRPWYAAAWGEAAVLAQRDDATDRIERARRATRDNPIAAAVIERAAAIAAGNRLAVVGLAATFAALGCPYQEKRTLRIADEMPAW